MRVNFSLLTVGELCPADNPLKMIYDYPFEMIYDWLFERSDSALNHFEMIYLLSLWNDISKETVLCKPLACSECLPIESWPNSIGKHPAEKSLLILSRWSMTFISKWPRKIFVQRIIFVRKNALLSRDENHPWTHIFVHRFFRSDCPLAAWK